MVVKNKESQAIPLAQVEEVLIRDLEGTQAAIAQIEQELANRRQERESLALMPAGSDPMSQARAMVEAERKAQELKTEESILLTTRSKLVAQRAEVQRELARIAVERDTSAAQALIDDVNGELLDIATEIQKLRDRQKKLLIRASKIAHQPQVAQALRALGIKGSFCDIWLPDRESSSFDSPSLGKLSSLKLVTAQEELKEHPASQRWSIVSQSLVSGRDL